MYLRRFFVENLRSIESVEMDFDKGSEPGWHVILGSNGSGKSSFVRAFALLMMGEKEAYASRQDFGRWIRNNQNHCSIGGTVSMDVDYDTLAGGGQPPQRNILAQVTLKYPELSFSRSAEVSFSGDRVLRTLWGGGRGWFSASFGPFRRFTGGDRIYDRLFVSNKRLAPHLTALGEDVALTEAMGWLTSLYVRWLQDQKNNLPTSEAVQILNAVIDFLNESTFLPHGAVISDVTDETVYVTDGNGIVVTLDQLSDGYRSALSLVVELIRQMFELYGHNQMMEAITTVPGTIQASGVVAIDEVDAHLHPTWQRDIGNWLTRCFPRVQFLVTTHSPIVCRAVANGQGDIAGSVWRLPAPGSSEKFSRVTGSDLSQLVYGDVLDAYSTQLFGAHVVRSEAGNRKLDRLAELNIRALTNELSGSEQAERNLLRATFPAEASELSYK